MSRTTEFGFGPCTFEVELSDDTELLFGMDGTFIEEVMDDEEEDEDD